MPAHVLGREELRLALVMNGGVSLAVWIGGVTREVGRLVSRVSAYGELCTLLELEPRVDVIAGTSAGGVNGAYLAMAIAHAQPGVLLEDALRKLRAVWIDAGAIEELLRSPFEKQPPSLLDGDGYYYEALLSSFTALRKGPATPPDDFPVDLILTGTLLKGEPQRFSDDYGSPVADVSHRATFHFRRKGRFGDQLGTDLSAAQLAVAARSTSSFPGAFEPSFCPVGPSDDGRGRPDMANIASFKTSRFLIDGGVLDNKPLDIALEAIFRQATTQPARRVLAYVVPAPESTAQGADLPEKFADRQGLLQTVLSSIIEIPSVQSISAQLEALRAHNEAVRDKRRSRVTLTRYNSVDEIERLSETLFAAYQDVRLARALDYILDRINEGLIDQGLGGLGRHGRRDWLHRSLLSLKSMLPWIPTVPPLDPLAAEECGPTKWSWGTRPIEHLSRTFLDLVVRAQGLVKLRAQPVDLTDAWNVAFTAIQGANELRSNDAAYWMARSSDLKSVDMQVATTSPAASSREWFRTATTGWSTSTDAGRIAYACADATLKLVKAVSPVVSETIALNDPMFSDDALDLQKILAFLVRQPNDTPEMVVRRLLCLEVVQESLGGRATRIEEEIDFIQITGDSDGVLASRNLTGVQLAHFGAFYKRSWRANDWLWGRRNCIRQLLRLILDPVRLRTIAHQSMPPITPSVMVNRLAAIATGFDPSSDPTALPLLSGFFAGRRHEIERELAYLADPAGPVPEKLSCCIEAIAMRLELEVLCDELPDLAAAVRQDQESFMATSASAQAFADQCLAARSADNRVSAETAHKLSSSCNLGGEQLAAEAATDPATRTVTQALAVSVAAVQGDKGLSKALGSAIGVLRAPTLFLFIFARNMMQRSRSGIAINAALAAAALLIVGTALSTAPNPYPHWLVLIAAAFLGPAIWLLITKLTGWKRTALAVLLLVVAAAFLWFEIHMMGLPAWRLIAILEGLILIGLALPTIFSFGPKHKRKA